MHTRRSFLSTATAATAAPFLWTSTSQAAASDKITLGIIGVGTQGRGHLGGMLGRPNVEVVAVCDVVKERLQNAVQMTEKRYADRIKSGQYKGVTAYTDFRKLLEHKDLDAVVIATPDHWHAIPCILAARAKKHIYCEKPLTHNVAEGRAIVDAVKAAKIIFQTGSQQRSEFGNRFRAAVEMIWNGWIGTLKTIRIGVGNAAVPCKLPEEKVPEGTDWETWLGPAPERPYHSDLCPKGVHTHFPAWRNYQEFAGGGLADMGAHHFDIAQWAMKMDASGPEKIIPPEDEKKTSGLKFVYKSGITMIHNEFAKGPDGKDIRADCVFEGTDGIILVGRGQLEVRFASGAKVGFPEKPERVTASSNHHINFLESVKAGKEAICPAEVGHRSATICHLGNIGYRLRRPLTWDPVKEKFVNDDKANAELTREPRAKWKLV
jgi:predicted dehydrogenase